MSGSKSSALADAIAAIVVPGIVADHRLIAEGDEGALLPEERPAFAKSVLKVRRASGAARLVARDLMDRLGVGRHPIPKATAGMPVWPEGVTGSLAHDATAAVAALSLRTRFSSIGIDVEPSLPLDAELVRMVATDREFDDIRGDLVRARALFAVKEAVYKAAYPLDGQFLDHHDVEIDWVSEIASVRQGRRLSFRWHASTHIVALAFVEASAPGM